MFGQVANHRKVNYTLFLRACCTFISHPQVHCQFVCVDAVLGRFYFVFISLFRARTKRTLIGNFRCKESGRESAPLAVHSCGLRERDGEKERAAHGLLLLGVGWPGFS